MSATCCPGCDKPLTAHRALGSQDEQPEPGDLTMCIYCLEPLAFTNDLQMRRQTEKERTAFMADEDVQRVYRMRVGRTQ